MKTLLIASLSTDVCAMIVLNALTLLGIGGIVAVGVYGL